MMSFSCHRDSSMCPKIGWPSFSYAIMRTMVMNYNCNVYASIVINVWYMDCKWLSLGCLEHEMKYILIPYIELIVEMVLNYNDNNVKINIHLVMDGIVDPMIIILMVCLFYTHFRIIK
eukprot:137711_1